MKTTIQAVYENGLLRPVERLNLPEKQVLSLTFDAPDQPEPQSPKRRPAAGKDVLDLAGLFPPDDLKEIEEAVRDCRQVDPNGW